MLRRFSVKVGGVERIVELGTDDDGKARVVVDGAERDVEVDAADGGWLMREGHDQTFARVDGDGAKVTVAIRRGGADVVVVGAEVSEARSAAVAALVRQARGAAAPGPASVRSPMPGRVVKILVRAGERVAAGQPVVVVEAMKMENELRAPRAGTVRELRSAEGAAVEAGQDLVVIDATEPA
jgi:glutaconyl-CoA/methylmalonyl-CoA decarboxylase subunit gamma